MIIADAARPCLPPAGITAAAAQVRRSCPARLEDPGSVAGVSEFDVFLADCPARTTLEVIGHTWSVVVIVALSERSMRHGELLERIGGISKKMLNQTLWRLQSNGLAVRADGRYALTDLGRSLLPPVRELVAWAEAHTGELLDAQDRRGYRSVPPQAA